MSKGFQCATCGHWHDELPLDLAFDEPVYVAELDAAERSRRVKGEGDFREFTDDEGAHYFIRGLIEIPIVGTDKRFCYGVWCSLSAQSYEAATSAYATGRIAGPFLGWFSNLVPLYPRTLNLKIRAHLRPQLRAAFELEPTDHPLAVEQRNGITMARVEEIVAAAMHALGPDARRH